MIKRRTRKHQTRKWKILYNVIDLFRMLFITGIVAVIVFQFIFRNKEIQGNSMYPTLVDSQRVFVNVAASYLTSIQRFDIVVAKSPDQEELWVKRVVGLPYETIEYYNDKLYVNSQPVEENFLDTDYKVRTKEQRHLELFTQNFGPITLGKDEYFLVGDNRNASLDSRSDEVGSFLRSEIIAKGLFVYSPWEKARYIINGN